MPQTSGGLEEMAGAKLAVAEPGKKLTKEQQKYNNQVFEAREATREKEAKTIKDKVVVVALHNLQCLEMIPQ